MYVAITRAERSLTITHALRRRLYGNEVPSEPSPFLNELPIELLEDHSYGSSWLSFAASPQTRHNRDAIRALTREREPVRRESNYAGKTYNSVDALRDFFAKKGIDSKAPPPPPPARPSAPAPRPKVKSEGGLRAGDRVKHPKYGVGLLLRIEGSGEEAKLTVSFPGFGAKKFVAKFVQLEKA